MIGHWLGWIASGCGVLSLFSYMVRKSKCKNKKLRHWFRGKHHHIWGELMLLSSILHGVLATAFSLCTMTAGGLAVACITGLLSLTVALFIKTTATKTQQFGKAWLRYHQLLTAILIPILLLHIGFRR